MVYAAGRRPYGVPVFPRRSSARIRSEADPLPQALNGLGADRAASQWGTGAGLRPWLPEDHDNDAAFRHGPTRQYRVGELVSVRRYEMAPPHQRLHRPRQWGMGGRLGGYAGRGHGRVPGEVGRPMVSRS